MAEERGQSVADPWGHQECTILRSKFFHFQAVFGKHFARIMEFFLNRSELSLNSTNSINLKITEAWAQFKDFVSTCVLLVLW